MKNKESQCSLGNVLYPDPTAAEAIGRIQQSEKNTLTTISRALRRLKMRKESSKITRREYCEQRAPLVATYKAHLIKKGGEKYE